MTDPLAAQAAAIWANAQAAAEQDTPGRHFTDHEENTIDRHLDACEGCRRCRRGRP
jgi:hypothetical protein